MTFTAAIAYLLPTINVFDLIRRSFHCIGQLAKLRCLGARSFIRRAAKANYHGAHSANEIASWVVVIQTGHDFQINFGLLLPDAQQLARPAEVSYFVRRRR